MSAAQPATETPRRRGPAGEGPAAATRRSAAAETTDYEPLVRAEAARYAGRSGDFDDLCQEARLAIWTALQRGLPCSRRQRPAYLKRLVHRRLRDVVRSTRRVARRECRGEVLEPADADALGADRLATLSDLLGRQPLRVRAAISALCRHRTRTAAARSLGVSPATLRARIEPLKKEVQDVLDEPRA